jgi:predicted GIY-YIG superfamily endonuclease
MIYVYLLVSRKDRQARYIGSTDDVDRRVKEHNSGKGENTRRSTHLES